MQSQGLKFCSENAGFGGDCLAQSDIDDLWRLHYEVSLAASFREQEFDQCTGT